MGAQQEVQKMQDEFRKQEETMKKDQEELRKQMDEKIAHMQKEGEEKVKQIEEQSGKDGLTLVSEPGDETTSGHDEEWHELVGVIGSLDFGQLGENLSPGEAVGENACVFSGNTVKTGRIGLDAVGIVSGSIDTCSGVGITVKI